MTRDEFIRDIFRGVFDGSIYLEQFEVEISKGGYALVPIENLLNVSNLGEEVKAEIIKQERQRCADVVRALKSSNPDESFQLETAAQAIERDEPSLEAKAFWKDRDDDVFGPDNI